MRVGVIGYGVVGKAMVNTFQKRKIDCIYYDKFVETHSCLAQCCETCELIFLALPTPPGTDGYDLSAIHETLSFFEDHNYDGLIVLKSTVLPGTTHVLQNQYSSLSIIHNPEFLSARTATFDYENQTHILIGITPQTSDEDLELLEDFFEYALPNIPSTICTSTESESTKIMCNAFYATKIQFFNEMYFYSKKCHANFNIITQNMINQGWINPMHTRVPGHDNRFSYGGSCLPKDTQTLLHDLALHDSPHEVLQAVCNEQKKMRNPEDDIRYSTSMLLESHAIFATDP